MFGTCAPPELFEPSLAPSLRVLTTWIARIIDYSVQRNHIHLIVEAKDYEHLARAMRGFAIRIARGLNQLMGTKSKSFC